MRDASPFPRSILDGAMIRMKTRGSRLLALAVLAILCWLALAGAASSKGPILKPDQLIILSTTDVKGKTSPCG